MTGSEPTAFPTRGHYVKTFFRALCAISTLAAMRIASAADANGTWTVSIEMQSGTSTAIFVLIQDGTNLTGRYKGYFGEASVSGTVKDQEVFITYQTEMQGVPVEVTYEGALDGNTMSGNMSIVGFGEGRFTGTRR